MSAVLRERQQTVLTKIKSVISQLEKRNEKTKMIKLSIF